MVRLDVFLPRDAMLARYMLCRVSVRPSGVLSKRHPQKPLYRRHHLLLLHLDIHVTLIEKSPCN